MYCDMQVSDVHFYQDDDSNNDNKMMYYGMQGTRFMIDYIVKTDINFRPEHYSVVLMGAIYSQYIDLVEYLLEYIDFDINDLKFHIDVAFDLQHYDIFKIVKRKQLKINIQTLNL